MAVNEEDIIKKVMLSIREFFSLKPRMKCRKGIILKSACKDLIAFLKLKRKNQVQSLSNDFSPMHSEQNHNFDYEFSSLVSNEKLPHSFQEPSAPPIPDSLLTHSGILGIKANKLLTDLEVYCEQVDYKGKGLVENVCHIFPSLIECQRKRTPKYACWAFTALGSVLHFLEITKVGEMNEEACECLQLLWDEVQVFGFELSWLAPQVEFALNLKGYVEKMSKVSMLEEEKRSLEMRIQELSVKLTEIEKEMASSKGDLEKLRVELGEPKESESLLGYQRCPAPMHENM